MHNNQGEKTMIEGHYTRKLTNEECSYKLVYFEADLLRNIIDDSRYVISNNSFKYNISITEEYDNDETLDEKFKFILDNVGLGFDENNERKFNILVLPTKKEYDNFIKVFDIMLSDNINQKFFEGQIDLIEFTNKDGTKEKYKGTIALLKE